MRLSCGFELGGGGDGDEEAEEEEEEEAEEEAMGYFNFTTFWERSSKRIIRLDKIRLSIYHPLK